MYSHFPNPTQLDFLNASLLVGSPALAAWERWKGKVDIERLDIGTYRLLPLLYLNLSRHGMQDPLMTRLKGAHRFTWVKNHRLQLAAAAIAQALSDGGVPLLFFKGLPLVVDCYADFGSRQMQDVDVLIPEASIPRTFEIMLNHGWIVDIPRLRNLNDPWSKGFVKYINGCDFRDPHRQTVDLHWRLLPENCDPSLSQSFWDEARPFEFHGVKAKRLRPEDMLIHLMLHGSRRDATPPFRWIADTSLLLKRYGDDFDWRFVRERCLSMDVVLVVRRSLEFLQKHFALDTAAQGVEALASVKTTERAAWEYKINAQRSDALREACFFWNRYRRIRRTHPQALSIFGFFRYLQYLAKLDSIFDIPRHALNKAGKLLFGVSSKEAHAGLLPDGRTTV